MRGDKIRGHLDAMLMSALAEGPTHGYGVCAWLRSTSDGDLDLPEGTVYPALHRLERDGLITSEQRMAQGRRQRVYRLTAAGRRALAAERAEWARFSLLVTRLLAVPS